MGRISKVDPKELDVIVKEIPGSEWCEEGSLLWNGKNENYLRKSVAACSKCTVFQTFPGLKCGGAKYEGRNWSVEATVKSDKPLTASEWNVFMGFALCGAVVEIEDQSNI